MDSQNVSVISDARHCGRCHITIAPFAPQVVDEGRVYHRECYEAWHLVRYGRRPVLLAGQNGGSRRYRVSR